MTQFIFFSACGTPPEITNGKHDDATGADRFKIGHVFNYRCESNYFPTGPHADELKTICVKVDDTSEGVYSPYHDSQLATCSPIGSFLNFCFTYKNILKVRRVAYEIPKI